MRYRRAIKVISFILLIVVSAASGLIFAMKLGAMRGKVGIFDMRISLRSSNRGMTTLSLKPFGQVSARTHETPVTIIMSVEDFGMQDIKDFVNGGLEYQALVEEMKADISPFLRTFLRKILLLAAAGGALGGLVGRPPRVWNVAVGAASGLAAVSILCAATSAQYDFTTFKNLKYRGALGEFTKLVPAVMDALEKSDMLKDRIALVSANIADFYLKLERLPDAGEEAGRRFTVLHISDLHNNPFAAEMTLSIARKLKPDIVADTGDITDLGTPLELKLLENIIQLGRPHYFVAGNHDSVEVLAAMKRTFGARILDGAAVSYRGLRIIGFADPKSRDSGPHGAEIAPGAEEQLEREARSVLEGLEEKPHILMIHNNDAALKLAGYAPLILTGHSHRARVRILKGSIIVNAGTSGASGIRYFKNEKTPDYSAALISILPKKDFAVEYVDIMRFDQFSGDFTLERKSFYSEDEADDPENAGEQENATGAVKTPGQLNKNLR